MNKKEIYFKFIRMIGDVIFMNLAFLTAFYIRFSFSVPSNNFSAFLEQVPYISIFTIIILYLYNLYNNQLKKNLEETFYSLVPSTIIIVLFSIVLSYFLQTYHFPRSVFLIVLPILYIYLFLWRYISLKIEKKFSKAQRIVVIGKGKESKKIVKNIKRGTNGGYKLEAVITKTNGFDFENDLNEKIKHINGFEKLEKELKNINPDLVFLSGQVEEEIKKELFYHSLEEDWKITLVPDFYEIMLAGAEMEQIGEFPVYEIKRLTGFRYGTFKRITDIIVSLFGLIITSPITLITTIAIKLESKGPIFFKQERISKNGSKFDVYKFRTMVNNAEKNTGPVLASQNDSRVTKVGNILRKTRIDEIPQLINVLKGDMSLIGPRPERPHFVEQFEKDIPDYKYRHRIKSGVTGLAQIFGYYSSDPEDKLRLDLLYANKAGIVFDLKIMLHTIKVMLMGHKAS